MNVSGSRVTLVLPGWMHRFRVVQLGKTSKNSKRWGDIESGTSGIIEQARDNRCILIASIPESRD